MSRPTTTRCATWSSTAGKRRILGLIDPRFLQDLGEVIPLDARRNAEPQRYNVMVQRQVMAGFFEPDMQAFLLFRYGRVGNRLLLLNTGATLEEAMKRQERRCPGRGLPHPGTQRARAAVAGDQPRLLSTSTRFAWTSIARPACPAS